MTATIEPQPRTTTHTHGTSVAESTSLVSDSNSPIGRPPKNCIIPTYRADIDDIRSVNTLRFGQQIEAPLVSIRMQIGLNELIGFTLQIEFCYISIINQLVRWKSITLCRVEKR